MLSHRNVPWRITFDTNPDDCNLHCIMCEQHSLYSPFLKKRKDRKFKPRRMSIELIERVLKQVAYKGLQEIIPSTMGEPLLYKFFDKIIDYCYEYEIKLNLTTNGSFPGRGAIKWANRIVPIGSDVKISWNGATKVTQESIMIGSNFEKHLQNITDFINVRDEVFEKTGNYCSVTLQMTFMKSNITEIIPIIKLASNLGIDRIKGHHIWVHFPELRDLSLRDDIKSIKRWNETVKIANESVKKIRLKSGKTILLDNFYPLGNNNSKVLHGHKCPFLGQEAWISTEGRFDPCCAPDEKRKSLGYFGNLYELDFLSIWNGIKYKQLLSSYSENPLCKQCLMRRPLRSKINGV